MANKNNDKNTITRAGLLNADNMTIEFYDGDSETTSVYSLNDPFKIYHDQDVEISISIKVNAQAKKVVNHTGEVLVDNEE